MISILKKYEVLESRKRYINQWELYKEVNLDLNTLVHTSHTHGVWEQEEKN